VIESKPHGDVVISMPIHMLLPCIPIMTIAIATMHSALSQPSPTALLGDSQPGLSPEQVLLFSSPLQPGSSPLLVDIRPRRAYHRRHVPGSHNIPHGRLVSSELPQQDLILIDDHGHDSLLALETIREQGFPHNVHQLSGGIQAWEAQGLPVIEQPKAAWAFTAFPGSSTRWFPLQPSR